MVDRLNKTRQRRLSCDNDFKDLLAPIFRDGKKIYPKINIQEIKRNAQENLNQFHSGIKRFVNPHQFPVGLEKSLFELKTDLIRKTKETIV